MASASRKTVLIALGANAGIAVLKLGGGAISGSAAMLAEGAHSIADTTNQVFMLVSLKLGERPPDENHPFGYGKERFFWAFLAAVFIFVAGAVFSIGEGLMRLLGSGGGSEGGFLVALIVLIVALLLEGTSLARAVRQTHGESQKLGLPFVRYIRQGRDPTSKTVVFEDTAAVTGVLIAMAGVVAHHVTGNDAYDAIASILIGVLLAIAAYGLGRDTKGLLLGEAARPEERERLREAIEANDAVECLLDMRTMALGPRSLLVAARVDLTSGIDSDAIERASEEIDAALRDAVPDVREVFLDATPGARARARARART